MGLLNLNNNTFKKDRGGILNTLIDNVVNKVEDKLENAVEDLFAGALKKIGLSSSVAREISARFGDSLKSGLADKYFREFNSEVNRATPKDICSNMNGGSSSAAEFAETTITSIQRASNNLYQGMPTFQFPSQIGRYYITFKFKQYQRPAPEAVGTMEFKQAFVLPLSRELSEQFQIGVSEKDQGIAGGAWDAVQKTLGTEEGGRRAAVADSAKALAYSYLVQKADEATAGAISQFTGAVPNPHVQALFTGVPLRTHRFDWTFSPRNEQESKTLMSMIKALKAYSLPSYSSLGTAALAYPFLCQPELKLGDYDGELIMFSPCLISDVSVNYSPQGMPAFFEGTDTPAFVQLSITMMETEIHTSNRYGRSGGDRISEIWEEFSDQVRELTGLDLDETLSGFEDVITGQSSPDEEAAPGTGGAANTAATDTPEPAPQPRNTPANNTTAQSNITGLGLGSPLTYTAADGTAYRVARRASRNPANSTIDWNVGDYVIESRAAGGSWNTEVAFPAANGQQAYEYLRARSAFGTQG